MRKLIVVMVVLLLSGCRTLAPQDPGTINSDILKGNGEMVTMPANLRTIDIRKPNAGYIVCSEPIPDVAMSNVLKLAMEVAQGQNASAASAVGEDSISTTLANTLGLKGNTDTMTTAMELAGRSQVVLLAREFLYRNCVARANNWINDSDFQKSQHEIIDQIANMIIADIKRAEAEKAKAQAAETAAMVVLDSKALQGVTGTFQQVKRRHALNEYNSCVTNAKGDEKKLKECIIEFDKNMQ